MTSPVLVPPAAGTGRPLPERTLSVPAMGGSLLLRVAGPPAPDAAPDHDLELVARRVERWAARLTRFTTTSDLAALNAAIRGGPARRSGRRSRPCSTGRSGRSTSRPACST